MGSFGSVPSLSSKILIVHRPHENLRFVIAVVCPDQVDDFIIQLLAIQDAADPAADFEAGFEMHVPLLFLMAAHPHQPAGQAGNRHQLFGADLVMFFSGTRRGLYPKWRGNGWP